jgi:hypothetical protein
MTGEGAFCDAQCGERKISRRGAVKIAGPFREHLAAKKKRGAALQPRALIAILAGAGSQEGNVKNALCHRQG